MGFFPSFVVGEAHGDVRGKRQLVAVRPKRLATPPLAGERAA